MSQIFSHPFRLAPNRSIAVVDQDSGEANREQLAVLALTRLGERVLVPGFGMPDPTFAGFEPTDLVAGVAAFGPPVRIVDVDVRPQPGGQLVNIEFS